MTSRRGADPGPGDVLRWVTVEQRRAGGPCVLPCPKSELATVPTDGCDGTATRLVDTSVEGRPARPSRTFAAAAPARPTASKTTTTRRSPDIPRRRGVLNNRLCWNAALDGFSSIAMPACDRGIALAPWGAASSQPRHIWHASPVWTSSSLRHPGVLPRRMTGGDRRPEESCEFSWQEPPETPQPHHAPYPAPGPIGIARSNILAQPPSTPTPARQHPSADCTRRAPDQHGRSFG
jgi:hypothetical protein